MTRTRSFISLFIFLLLACRHESIVIPQDGNNNGTTTEPGAGEGTGSAPGATCNPDTIYFQQQVLPILVSSCTLSGCHDDRSHRDGVVLTSYTSVMNTGEISPGNPSGSELYEAITEKDADDRMPRPPASPLTNAQKDIIYNWIKQGAKNLSCENGCDNLSAATYSAVIKPLFAAKCTGCHGGASPQAAIDLSTYNGVKSKVNDGRLRGALYHMAGYSPMPKNGMKLSECELAQVSKWINAGSLNN